jgi:hypothetical protein
VAGLSVYSANLDISYDPTVLEAINVDTTGTMVSKSGWNMPSFRISSGQISIGMAENIPLSGRGNLINIVFKVLGSYGDSSPLQFVSAKLNEGDPPVFTTDGFVYVFYFDIKGRLKYYSNIDTSIADAVVQLTGEATLNDTSDIDGNYEFVDLMPGDYTVTPQKSNETRDAIMAYDASFVLRYSVGTLSLTPYQKISADVTGSDSVTAYDASFILRYSIGLIKSFPVGSDWTFVPHDYPMMIPTGRSHPDHDLIHHWILTR